MRVIIRGWARVAHSRILQTFSSSLGRRVLSWSFATLFLAFPMLVTLFGIMWCHEHISHKGEWGSVWLLGINWINVDMRVLSTTCDCCSSLWSKNCSFCINFEVTIGIQWPFPIMLVMAGFVFWMPGFSYHHHSKQIRRQHLGMRRSVLNCLVVCCWILPCPPPTVSHVVWKYPLRKKNSLLPVSVASNKPGQGSRDHQKIMLFLYLTVLRDWVEHRKALVWILQLLSSDLGLIHAAIYWSCQPVSPSLRHPGKHLLTSTLGGFFTWG